MCGIGHNRRQIAERHLTVDLRVCFGGCGGSWWVTGMCVVMDVVDVMADQNMCNNYISYEGMN